ncbi:WXG100 family type VII secretion target [Saccharopolyspora sp. 5N708]|uniref:WXG100 family type VII secretion target n=1 Tax=Saccharopolyspora sp. 5N708 TaxID=3457424 RepID=UPI003FD4DD75
MNEKISVDPSEIRSTAKQARELGGQLADLRRIVGEIDELGEFWGGDDRIGKQFAEGYQPAARDFAGGVRNLGDSYLSTGEALNTSAQRWEGTESANVDDARSVQRGP